MSWKISGESYEAVARATGTGRFSVVLGAAVSPAAADAGAAVSPAAADAGANTIEVEARVDRDGTLVMTMPDGRVVRAGISFTGDERWVTTGARSLRSVIASGKARAADAHGMGMEAPMPGRIVRVAVAVGDVVKKGQTVVTLEAMKMEHALKAPRDGVVREVGCREGELVQAGVALVVLAELDKGAEGGAA